MDNIINQNILKAELFGRQMLDEEDRYSKIKINHIPFMITDTHKVVCIPDYGETTHVGITAMTGKGKGIAGNTLIGFEYWMKKTPCIVLNDFQQETFEWSLPSMNGAFNNNLGVLNIKPTGYPLVYVYPNNVDLFIGETESLFPTLRMTLPTSMVIRHVERFYDLDKSAKYLTANIEQFEACKDIADVEEVLEDILPEEQGKKKFAEMKYKMITVFKNIFNEEICSSSAPSCPSHLTIEKGEKKYNNLTIQALMFAGFIPSIQTVEIRSKPWFSAYMSFIVESIYEDKYRDEFLKNIPITMYVPEIDKMWKGADGDYIKKALSLIGTNGRRAGIRLIWDAQDYEAVPDAIRSNTKHLIVLRKTNSEEVRGIKKDFNVDKETEEKILGLITDPSKGKFEAVALTSDRFILYDLRDGSMSATSQAQKGRLITPMAQHKAPGVKIGDLI